MELSCNTFWHDNEDGEGKSTNISGTRLGEIRSETRPGEIRSETRLGEIRSETRLGEI